MQAIHIPPQGTATPVVSLEDRPADGLLWIDFIREESEDWATLIEQAGLGRIHEAHIRDSMNLEHPSHVDAGQDYEMLLFRGLTPGTEGIEIRSRPLAVFLADGLVITVRPADSRTVRSLSERLLTGRGRLPRTAPGLLHALLTSMVDRFLELRSTFDERLVTWQDQLLDPSNPFEDWQLLLRQRSELRRLEALSEEQQVAVSGWIEDTRFDIDAHLRIRLNDLLEHVRRVLSHAQHLRSELESLVQMHFSATAHRTNEIVQLLTVVSAIFLPLTFIAGLFGMNFVPMPGGDGPWGFWIAVLGMSALAGGLVLIFHRRRWL